MKLRELAYEAFTQHLLTRQLLPGQFVSQRELAEATCMSLASIREMISRLEAEGLIRVISQRGLQIVRIDSGLVRDSFQLRQMIEVQAVAAFVRTAPDHVVAEECARLESVQRRMADGVTTKLLQDAQAADWAMHDAFVAQLGNRIVEELHRVNSVRIRMILGERIGLSARRLPVALAEHAAVLRCVERRDEPGAVAALVLHLASSQRRATFYDPASEQDELDQPPDLA